MDYLDINNIYKPETITLKFEDYQNLLNRIRNNEEFENKLQELVKDKKLVYLQNKSNPNIVGFVTPDRITKRQNHWEIIE